MKKLLIATTNKGKMREIKQILKDLPFSTQGGPASGWNFVNLNDAGVNFEIEEIGKTFKKNALLKAKIYSKKTGFLTLAEDSGLEIDALAGKPGVYSARFLERNSQKEKNQAILEKMRDIPEERRTARFIDMVAVAKPTGEIKTVEGVMKGKIAFETKGDNGFGYDPIFIPHLLPIARSCPDKYLSAKGAGFIPNKYNKTNAELSSEEKNKISHRGKAFRKAFGILKEFTNN